MSIFILQTVKGIIRHDFVLDAYDSIEYYEWRREKCEYVLCEIEELESTYKTLKRKYGDECGFYDPDCQMIVPVGTIEFVRKYLSLVLADYPKFKEDMIKFFDDADFPSLDMAYFVKSCVDSYGTDYIANNFDIDSCMRPLNIPLKIFNRLPNVYLGRKVVDYVPNLESGRTVDDVKEDFRKVIESIPGENIFVKDNLKIKSKINNVYGLGEYEDETIDELCDKTVQISEILDDTRRILSEYRCFVHNGNVRGIQYYSGDFRKFPNVDTIDRIVRDLSFEPDFINRPYTLDVAVLETGQTVVIEMHEFYSCGSYGFYNYNAIMPMLTRTWKNVLVRSKEILEDKLNCT